jgi:hypothetical protein
MRMGSAPSFHGPSAGLVDYAATNHPGPDIYSPKHSGSETSVCATGECAAGLLPAHSEMRANEQIARDIQNKICGWAVGQIHPLPGSTIMKPIYYKFGKIVGWVAELTLADATSSAGESLILRN